MTADWPIRDSEFPAIVTADQWVLFGGRAYELTVVCPLLLDELELSVEVGSNKGEYEAAIGAIILQYSAGQLLAIVGASPNHAVKANFADDD